MKEKIYFNNLNGLRGIAALLVIISHIELNKSYFNISNSFQKVKDLGWLGVSLFFVLSGFLITYLLLKEKQKNGFISLKKFYLRRIYRIWPLYYFIMILSLVVLPNFEVFHIPNLKLDIESPTRLFVMIGCFVFFLTNVLISIKLIPFATQTWSIGTEEQFYLIWPLLISKCQRLKPIFISIVLGYNLVLLVLQYRVFSNFRYFELLNSFVHFFQLDCLTLGALGAYLYYCKSVIVEKVTHLYVFFCTLVLVVISVFYSFNLGFFKATYYAILFIILILNLINHPKLAQLLEAKPINYLGKISYGLYMYHQIIIVFVLNSLSKTIGYHFFVLYFFTFGLSIFVASLSYQFLELPFLKIKEKLH
ncbi:acyltransferase family protein [Flavobacterium aciduliphilum]|uniref:Peptidoglycan/LPS O-acetylase OafA/YrhL n=1 Tax=Flavobacterium aciduliphilum TaxID=1101402 RepID=A0A328YR68_9FLAO|nr:acyltransferase [Flavobacterium aciduliphilum]RAR75623.1 peptidoglycan/LPS O-acetylase OafA/YrhL [Flavobacterium aciduliphilum]